MVNRPYFIVLDGIDGSGTTTHVHELTRYLGSVGIKSEQTREPSRGSIGLHIRGLLENTDEKVGWETMALLFAADRTQHLENEIVPLLDKGITVVCDRYVLSSLTYQSETSPEGSGAIPWLRSINRKARNPDLTIILDVPAIVAAERRVSRGGKAERFEIDELQEKLVYSYRTMPSLLCDSSIVTIDSNRSKSLVFDDIRESVMKMIDENEG